MDIDQQIRLRAYEIWVAAGMGEGDAERHWLQAELAVTRKSAAARPVAVKPVAKAKSAPSAKPATYSKSVKSATGSKAVTPRRTKATAARVGAEASV